MTREELEDIIEGHLLRSTELLRLLRLPEEENAN